MLRRLLISAAATALVGLALAPLAAAHVTVNPREAAAGAFVVLDVRVPNERDNASTTKVDVQLPPGFVEASYQPEPGWTVEVTKEKLAQPIQTDDGPVTEQVSEITWTATGDGIAPGQFMEFPISVQVPGKAGDTLVFKAVQTYSNGEVVRWIGAEGSEEPAPRLQVTAATAEDHAAAAADEAEAAAAASDASSDDSSTKENLALAFGIAGLVAGLGALGVAFFRRPKTA
jgi:uncharacterized protein